MYVSAIGATDVLGALIINALGVLGTYDTKGTYVTKGIIRIKGIADIIILYGLILLTWHCDGDATEIGGVLGIAICYKGHQIDDSPSLVHNLHIASLQTKWETQFAAVLQ